MLTTTPADAPEENSTDAASAAKKAPLERMTQLIDGGKRRRAWLKLRTLRLVHACDGHRNFTPASLPQLCRDRVEPGAHARLVHAGGAGEADSADDVIADLDRHAARDGNHMGEGGLLAPYRPRRHFLDELFR